MRSTTNRAPVELIEVGPLSTSRGEDTALWFGDGLVAVSGNHDVPHAEISLRGDNATPRVTIGVGQLGLTVHVDFVRDLDAPEVRIVRPADAAKRADTPSDDQQAFLRFMPCDADGDPALLLGGNLAEHEGLFAGLADAAWAGGGDEDAASGIQPTHVARVEVRVLDVWPVATVAASEVPAP